MRILVAWSSKRGGTEGIGRILRDALEAHGFETFAASVDQVRELDSFDAVIVGSALYSSRWTRGAVRFVNRHLEMARTKSGDWRNVEIIRAWADELAKVVVGATPLAPVKQPERSISRLLVHGIAGWAMCALTMSALLHVVSQTTALVIHAAAAPLFFTLIAVHYFRSKAARNPLPTAAVWTSGVALFDLLVVANMMQHGFQMFASLLGTWVPFALIFLATWATGMVMSILPASGTGLESRRQAQKAA